MHGPPYVGAFYIWLLIKNDVLMRGCFLNKIT